MRRTQSQRARTFKCQYHHWEYELDGSFHRIPDLDTFPQGAPPYALTAVTVRFLGRLRLVQPEPTIRRRCSNTSHRSTTHLDPYNFRKMAQTRDITVEWDCNWKASVDAFNESYHVQGIHPQLLWYLHDLDIQIDCYERHSRYLIPFGTCRPRVRTPPAIPEPIKVIMKAAGMDPGRLRRARREHPPRRAALEAQAWPGAGQGLFAAERRPAHRRLPLPDLPERLAQRARGRPDAVPPTAASDRSRQDVLRHLDLRAGARCADGTPRSGRAAPGTSISSTATSRSASCSTRTPPTCPACRRACTPWRYKGLWIGRQELRIRHFHKVIDDYIKGRAASHPAHLNFSRASE